MSFAEKIKGLLTRPNQSETAGDEAPWYFTYGSRALGVVGAFFAILFGVWNAVISMVTIDIICCVSGIVQIAVGFGIMALEVPGCFFCIDYVSEIASMVDKRPVWNRAALYCGVSLVPVIMCPGLASIFACGLIFGTGVIYGMMSLGKKASAEEMRQAAMQSGLAGETPAGDRISIVRNAQPFSFTGAVGTDSNV